MEGEGGEGGGEGGGIGKGEGRRGVVGGRREVERKVGEVGGR